MTGEQHRSQARHQRILDAALEVFTRRGFRESAVDDIAAASGTSKGGIYFHFPNKSAIFDALLQRTAGLLVSRAEGSMTRVSDPIAKVDAALVTVLRLFAEHRTLARLFLVEAPGAGAEFSRALMTIHADFAGLIARHLDEAVRTGAIAPLDTELAGVAWFGALNEVVVRWALTGRPERLEDAYPALRALLLRGVGAPVGGYSYGGGYVVTTAPVLAPDSVRTRLREAAHRAHAGGKPVLVSISTRLPAHDPLDLFAQAAGLAGDRFYWERHADGVAMASVGAAYALESLDPASAGRAWRALLDSAQIDGAEDDLSGPVLCGGFAFDPMCHGDEPTPCIEYGAEVDQPSSFVMRPAGSPAVDAPTPRPQSPSATMRPVPFGRTAPPVPAETAGPAGQSQALWRGFPAGRLVLPRLTLATSGGAAVLTVNAVLSDDSDPDTEAARLLQWCEAAFPLRPRQVVEPYPLSWIEEMQPREAWEATVEQAARACRDGLLEKVVLARAVQAHAGKPFDGAETLARLRTAYPGAYVFAVANGDACFLGATPERLVKLHDHHVEVACLAGSAPRGGSPEEDAYLGNALLASPKDREEHAVVARGVLAALDGVCTHVHAPTAPRLLRLRNVQHLYTPFTGQAGEGVGVLDLVQRLHPTPAVGGLPREEALRFIREREGLERGWYAGPVGWLNRHGDGEFAVALRSALLSDEMATLFAGCGIVADSLPADEYEETRLKLRPMLTALGGDEE